MSYSFIYLVQDGEFINTDIYKIGKTQQDKHDARKINRIQHYSLGTVIYYIEQVNPLFVDVIESLLISKFSQKYKRIHGREWFRGDINDMIFDIKVLLSEREFCLPKYTYDISSRQIHNIWKRCNNDRKRCKESQSHSIDNDDSVPKITFNSIADRDIQPELASSVVGAKAISHPSLSEETNNSTDDTQAANKQQEAGLQSPANDLLKCKRCGYRCSTKTNLLKHLRRQNKCEPIYENIMIDDYINALLTKQYNDKTYDCEHCNKKFNTYQSRWRHYSVCKILTQKFANDSQIIRIKSDIDNLNNNLNKTI
jgi:hypothetical protein